MEERKNCSKCGKEYRVKAGEVFGIKNFFTLNYCPEHQEVQATMPPITTLKGNASKKIDKKTGLVRIKGISPKEWAKRDIMVKTFPRDVVTKPSEWKSSARGRVYKTQEKMAQVYPNLSRGDIVLFSGFLEEGILYATMMLNQTLGIKTEFIEPEVKLKKGIFSSFTIRNPILIENEKMIEKLSKAT